MNTSAKRRLSAVGLIIIAVAIVLFVVIGSQGVARSLSVAQAASGDYEGSKVQVSGAIADDSYETEGLNTTFTVLDENDASVSLTVVYEGALPATFGNGVTAICTGVLQDGRLNCTELVTKCPSKYESAEGSLTVDLLLKNANVYRGVSTRLGGYVTEGSLADATADVRFVINSQGSSIDVVFSGALPDGITDGSAVVVTGMLAEDDTHFTATDVALDESIANQE